MQARQGDVSAGLPHHLVLRPLFLLLLGSATAIVGCAKDTPDGALFAGDAVLAADTAQISDTAKTSETSGNSDASAGIDTAADDTAALDTAALDTAALDTAADDTAALDTAADDSAADDTAALDIAADDSAADDTGAPDTTVKDTTEEDIAPTDSTGCLTAKDCDDSNVCTTDVCNPTSGACEFKPHTGSCDDGDPCTLDDTCDVTTKKCKGGGDKLFVAKFGGKAALSGATVARSGDVLIIGGQVDSKAAVFGVTLGGAAKFSKTITKEPGAFMTATMATDGGFVLGGWKDTAGLPGSRMMIAKVGKTGVDLGFATLITNDSHAETRALLPTDKAQLIEFAGVTSSAAGTWRAVYGKYDTTQHKASGNLSILGGFSDHRAAYAMASAGTDRVIAGWTATQGSHKNGWLYRMSSAGFKVWEFGYGKGSDEAFEAVTLLGTDIIAAGWSDFSPTNKKDVYLVRTSSKGAIVWERRFGTDADDFARGIVAVSGGLVLVGAAAVISASSGAATTWFVDEYGGVGSAMPFNTTGRVIWDEVLALDDGLLLAGDRSAGADAGLRLARTDTFGFSTCVDSGQCAGFKHDGCSDGKPCTSDSCTPSGGCKHTNNKVGLTCGAAKTCTKTAVCN